METVFQFETRITYLKYKYVVHLRAHILNEGTAFIAVENIRFLAQKH